MKQISFGLVLMVALWGCSNPSQKSNAENQDSTMQMSSGGTTSAVEQPLKPAEGAQDEAVHDAGVMKGLEGMNLETSMEMDDFRERLEHDWGDVHNILRASGAEFKQEGADYLVMEGEIKQGGFPWSAIMIIDLKQDAVFAAQFDGENKRIDQFEEEKEGLNQPAPLTRWTKSHQ